MKLSVSLPEDDVRFIDAYSRDAQLNSRSAAIQKAVQSLRESLLAEEYDQMFSDSGYLAETDAWNSTAADGLDDEAW